MNVAIIDPSSNDKLRLTTKAAAPNPTYVVDGQYVTTREISIADLVRSLAEGEIEKAPHQRKFVWNKRKIEEWVTSIIDGVEVHGRATAISPLMTYQIPGNKTEFLNDGFQRLTAATEFLEYPQKFRKNLSKEDAARIARKFYCLVQIRNYTSHEKALIDFQLLNYGTPMTNLDFCKGFLLPMEASPVNWLPSLEDLNLFMEQLLAQVNPNERMVKIGSNRWAYWYRHDYVLLYRYLTRSTNLKLSYREDESITPAIVPLRTAREGRVLEQRLRSELDRLGMAEALTRIQAFQNFIRTEAKTIKNVWITQKGTRHPALGKTVWRWLFGVAIWRSGNQLPLDLWIDFLNKLFAQTIHASELKASKREGGFVLGLEHILLEPICADIDSTLYQVAAATANVVNTSAVKANNTAKRRDNQALPALPTPTTPSVGVVVAVG
jgi:hypothetical protein